MRTLVTGASGFIGSRLVQSMLAQGVKVRGTYRRTPAEIPGIAWSPAQLDGPQPWRDLVADADTVVHLAALVHQTGDAPEGRWPDYERINVNGTRALARACGEAGVRRLVFVSSIAVYGRATNRIDDQSVPHPEDDYGRSKLGAEEALRSELSRSATDWCVLRPPLVYGGGSPGNLRRLQTLIASRLPLPFGAIRNRRSFIFIDNLVDAIMTVLRYPHDIRASYVLSDGSDFSTPELVCALAAGRGRRVRLVHLPVTVLRTLGRAADLTARVTGIRAGLDGRSIDSLVGSLVVDSSRFREVFAWHPPVDSVHAFELAYGAPPYAAHLGR